MFKRGLTNTIKFIGCAMLLGLASSGVSTAGAPYATETLKATRILTETYPCDGISRNITYRLWDSIGGHPPITSSVRAVRFWSGNYTEVGNNARVAAFRDTVAAVAVHDLLHQHFVGQVESTTQYPLPGFLITPSDSVTFDIVCFGGGLQTTAVWMTYQELPR